MHRAYLVAMVALSITLLVRPAAVWADEEGPASKGPAVKDDHKPDAKAKEAKKDAHGGGGSHDGEGGIFGWAVDLFIWTLIVFLLLLFVLNKYAWKPMLEALIKREDNIRTAVEEAQHARAETERIRAQFKAEMDQAFAKIPQLMDEARKNADKLVEDKLAKASADIQAERERLRREMQIQLDQALQTLWDRTAELATLISGRVLARTLTPDDHQRLFQMAAEELQSSGQHDGFVKA